MMRRRLLLGGSLGAACGVRAQGGPAAVPDLRVLPGYTRLDKLAGTVVAAGSSTVAALLRPLTERFAVLQPGVDFDIAGAGSSTALAAMLLSSDALGLLSRPMNAREHERFRERWAVAPLELPVAVDAVAIYAFKDNPVPALSLADLQRAFGKDAGAATRWGDLGLQDAWANVPLQRYGLEAGRGAYELMRELVLKGRDFTGDVSVEPVSTSVVQGVATHSGGLGYASVFFRTTRTRVLPLWNQGQAVEPTAVNAASGRYPLSRFLYVCAHPRPQPPALALQRQFLQYLLSRDAQEVMARQGVFPLDAGLARRGLQLLGVAEPAG
jgi:phosphate transport system substrate-binding protein